MVKVKTITFSPEQINAFLERNRSYLIVFLYVFFVYIMSRILFLSAYSNRDIVIILCLFLAKTPYLKWLFKLTLALVFYTIICPLGLMVGFFKQISIKNLIDISIGFGWAFLSVILFYCIEFSQALYTIYVIDMQKVLDTVKSTKTLALSPVKEDVEVTPSLSDKAKDTPPTTFIEKAKASASELAARLACTDYAKKQLVGIRISRPASPDPVAEEEKKVGASPTSSTSSPAEIQSFSSSSKTPCEEHPSKEVAQFFYSPGYTPTEGILNNHQGLKDDAGGGGSWFF